MGHSLESGASIIEICIAILIIGMSALIIAMFSRNTFNMYSDSRGSDAAFIAGKNKIADLSAEAIPDISGTDTVTIDNVTCIRSWTVKDTVFVSRANVTVKYDLYGKQRELKVSGALN